MKTLSFSLRFLAIYAALLGVFLWTPVGRVAGELVSRVGGEILQIGLGRPADADFEYGDMKIRVPPHEKKTGALTTLDGIEHTRNIPLVLAACLAFPWRPLRRMAASSAGAMTLCLLIDGAIVAGETWAHNTDVFPATAAYHAFEILGTFHTTGVAGLFAAPVFVMLFGTLVTWTEGGRANRGPRPQRRNASCACGSGKKYKRCCGEL